MLQIGTPVLPTIPSSSHRHRHVPKYYTSADLSPSSPIIIAHLVQNKFIMPKSKTQKVYVFLYCYFYRFLSSFTSLKRQSFFFSLSNVLYYLSPILYLHCLQQGLIIRPQGPYLNSKVKQYTPDKTFVKAFVTYESICLIVNRFLLF